jgi:hypothetical protein
MGALLLILIVQYSNSSAADTKAVRAARARRELSQRLDDISQTMNDMSKDLSDARLARADVSALTRRLDALESRPTTAAISPADLSSAVDAALERRREAFVGNMEGRGEAMAADMAEIAKRVDFEGIRTSLRKTADNFREGAKEGKKGERTEAEKKTDETIAKGFDAMAEGLDLWRKRQAGELTEEEFRKKSRELREKARKQFGNFGGFGRRRNRDNDKKDGGEGAQEGGDEKF